MIAKLLLGKTKVQVKNRWTKMQNEDKKEKKRRDATECKVPAKKQKT